MSIYKLILPILVCLAALVPAVKVVAQEQEEYTIQFLPIGENGSAVDHHAFPTTRVQFLIMQDGEPLQTDWSKERFRLFEDDREIPFSDWTYEPSKQPLDVTIVYQFVDYVDVERNGPHKSVLEAIENRLGGDIRLRSLCLTMVSAMEPMPCKAINNGETLENAFSSRTDFSKQIVVSSIRGVNYQLIWDSILAERVEGRPHQVLWVLDDDMLTHGKSNTDLLPVNENQLTRLKEADVSLIFIDLTPADDLQHDPEWENLLGAFDIRHLTWAGVNYLQTSSCKQIWDCMKEVMEPQRSLVHTLSYNSALFVDSAQHSLRVQLLGEDNESPKRESTDPEVKIVGQERADFEISPPYQAGDTTLSPGVLFFSKLFNAVAMIVLISVLVLIKRPQDDTI